jgi:hypothetical protein
MSGLELFSSTESLVDYWRGGSGTAGPHRDARRNNPRKSISSLDSLVERFYSLDCLEEIARVIETHCNRSTRIQIE